MNEFYLNGYYWRIEFVDPDSELLVDRTGRRTVATTDPMTKIVYISSILVGDKSFFKVLIHELGHCALISFNLLEDIHRVVLPEYWIDAEEWVCNFIADYGLKIFEIAYAFLGRSALEFIPYELERLIA